MDPRGHSIALSTLWANSQKRPSSYETSGPETIGLSAIRGVTIPDAVELNVSHPHSKTRLSAASLLNSPRQHLGYRSACLLFDRGAELLDDRTPVCSCRRSQL